MPLFARYLGIDYSGAETPTSSLKGLRVFAADGPSILPVEVPPPPSPRKYWTRKGLAHWLAERIESGPPTLIGIDHAFSFPLPYFERHALARDWPAFLDDFDALRRDRIPCRPESAPANANFYVMRKSGRIGAAWLRLRVWP